MSGLGKSRLCTELFAYLEQRPEPFSLGARGDKDWCSLRRRDPLLGTRRDTRSAGTPPTSGAVLDRRASGAGEADRAWLLGRLAPLVGVPWSLLRRRRARFCSAAERTTVLVFEDLRIPLCFVEHPRRVAGGRRRRSLHRAAGALRSGGRPSVECRNSRNGSLFAGLTDTEAQLVAALLERGVGRAAGRVQREPTRAPAATRCTRRCRAPAPEAESASGAGVGVVSPHASTPCPQSGRACCRTPRCRNRTRCCGYGALDAEALYVTQATDVAPEGEHEYGFCTARCAAAARFHVPPAPGCRRMDRGEGG